MREPAITPITPITATTSTLATALFGSALLLGCGGDGGDGPPVARYRIGGTLSGLAGGTSVTLQNNGADDLRMQADGAFAFPSDDPAFAEVNAFFFREDYDWPQLRRDCAAVIAAVQAAR